jgi:hypothetical protein
MQELVGVQLNEVSSSERGIIEIADRVLVYPHWRSNRHLVIALLQHFSGYCATGGQRDARLVVADFSN